MQYLGIDWGTRRAAWCALDDHGEINEGAMSADQGGLARLVHTLGPDIRGCIEMMSGAVWVRDKLAQAGWEIQIADARKVKAIAPLACKTDRVDARVLAELVPARPGARGVGAVIQRPGAARAASSPRSSRSPQDLGHEPNVRAADSVGAAGEPDSTAQPETLEQLAEDGLPPVWLASIRTLLSVIDDLDRQISPIERELRPIAHNNDRVRLLMTIPGVAELLGLTLVAEIGDISRFPTARKLVGYSGLSPTIKQSGQSSRTGRISKAGPNTLRWAAVEAAQHAWRPSSPWHRLYTETKRRHGKSNPAKAAVARKVLIACWHVLSLNQPFKPSASSAPDLVPASSSTRLAA
ncbi:MAG: IS110 family RNA-guided transposase [Solirubrobacteraceae bacterium]